jgi:2'-5' RNA ligase
MTYRPKLFAAIDLDDKVRARCAEVSARLERQGLTGRFEPPEKLHITLAFLGWVDPEQVDPIREALRVTASQTAPFIATLDKLGAFPNERNPHVVWIGARDQGAEFRDLARALRAAFGKIGFAFDKDAVTHVTLARIKEQRVHLPLLEFEPIKLHVDELTLFDSLPDKHTTRYEVRDRAPLARPTRARRITR